MRNIDAALSNIQAFKPPYAYCYIQGIHNEWMKARACGSCMGEGLATMHIQRHKNWSSLGRHQEGYVVVCHRKEVWWGYDL
jgi:hypothetical protein